MSPAALYIVAIANSVRARKAACKLFKIWKNYPFYATAKAAFVTAYNSVI